MRRAEGTGWGGRRDGRGERRGEEDSEDRMERSGVGVRKARVGMRWRGGRQRGEG